MLKRTIWIDEHTDPHKTLKEFSGVCHNSELADASALIDQVEQTINELSDRGSHLASVGSQFNIKRILKGDDFRVTLKASFGEKKRSFFSKLLG